MDKIRFETDGNSEHFSCKPDYEILKARNLEFGLCSKKHAIALNILWHSQLPKVQKGPWQFAFKGHHFGKTYVVALWNNPSSRMLPNHWLELRRLACSEDAPKNTASRFLSFMVKYFKKNYPEKERCISYQDTLYHKGIIYKAAGWEKAYFSPSINRDRTLTRKGTGRLYRVDMNGKDVSTSAKIRWEKEL